MAVCVVGRSPVVHRSPHPAPRDDCGGIVKALRACGGTRSGGVLRDGSAFAPWLETFESEVAAFPMSKFADQVDSMVQFLASVDIRTRWTMNLTAFRDYPEQPF